MTLNVTLKITYKNKKWIYNKKVDKYDKIEDRKRRNKNVFKKSEIHPGI